MGYVPKNRMLMTDDGRPYTAIGRYHIVKESEKMTGIYFYHCGLKILVTSKPKWSQAIKLAKLLNESYNQGYESALRDSSFD